MFVWPKKVDELLTFHADILTPVEEPIPVSSGRGFVGLNAADLALTLYLYRRQN